MKLSNGTKIFSVKDISQLEDVMGFSQATHKDAIIALYFTTKRALQENIYSLLNLGEVGHSETQEELVLEIQEFRQFLTNVENTYPQVLDIHPEYTHGGIFLSERKVNIDENDS